MKRIIFLLFVVGLSAEEQKVPAAKWIQHARAGLSQDQSVNGGHIYYRLNRRSPVTFRDLRLFGYGLGDDSYIYIRYKSSIKYNPDGKLYNFTTASYQKNTRAELDLRYHFNQGIGYFISDYNTGHIHTELGHAYDMSNYLNDTRKTSYLKGGLFWDHEMNKISSKFDAEWFQQISDIVDDDLSRLQIFAEITYHLNNSLAFIVGFEQDYYTASKQSPQSYYLSLGWQK